MAKGCCEDLGHRVLGAVRIYFFILGAVKGSRPQSGCCQDLFFNFGGCKDLGLQRVGAVRILVVNRVLTGPEP